MAIAAGLVAGVVVGAAGLGAVLALYPAPSLDPAATPVASGPTPTPVPSTAGSASIPPAETASPVATASPDTGFGIGQPAPELAVPQLGGGEILLDNLRGKPVWVNFMATWCLPCRDELPLMNGFAARYADEGLVVLAIDVREDEASVAGFMNALNVIFPVGLDGDGTAQREWGALALPVHFWVDADGVVRDGALGGIGPDIMAAGLRTIMPGVDVQP